MGNAWNKASKNDLFMTIKYDIDEVLLVDIFCEKNSKWERARNNYSNYLSEFAKDKIRIGL